MIEEGHLTIYRQTSIGLSLEKVLGGYVESQRISVEQKERIMGEFDRVVSECLERLGNSVRMEEGECAEYKNISRAWSFILTKVKFNSKMLKEACLNGNECEFVNPKDKVKVVLVEDEKIGKKRKRLLNK